MLQIRAHFEPTDQVSLHDIYDMTGVYVLWNAHALSHPSYIGEGNLLRRFVSHLDKPWARRPLIGTVAIIDDGTPLECKWRAKTVEAVLLRSAEESRRTAAHNQRREQLRGLQRLLQREARNTKIVRIVFTGHDPLKPPGAGRLRDKRIATLRWTPEGWDLEHSWRAPRA